MSDTLKSTIKVGTRTIELSNQDKILFPKSKITKGDLVTYYQKIAPYMVPHVKDRPLSMLRYPNGITHEGFYQKETPDYFPSWIKTVTIAKKEDGKTNYVMMNDAATLAYLANQGLITPHIWLSRAPKVNNPDRLIFDLDPSPGVGFDTIRWAARELKKKLEEKKLPVFIMTTGSRGVHVVVPLKRLHTFDQVKSFAHAIARELVTEFPSKLTLEMSKAKRGKRIFVDTLRNAFAQTGVAPYGVRAIEGAPVAAPIEWKELGSVTPQKFTIKNIFRRLKAKGDLWKNIEKDAVKLPKIS
jgi:bifunctional non-homologous end joining protein LigD